MGDGMAIYRLLRDGEFEPRAVAAMASAYEDLLRDLQLVDRADPFTEIVANKVIEVAQLGVHNSAEIRQRVLIALGRPQ
jgi:hypothetical protein